MKFDLVRPCQDCPFLIDRRFELHPRRIDEIARALTVEDSPFACHKTVDYSHEDTDDDGNETRRPPNPKLQHCAGALIVLERKGLRNQWAQISARMGWYHPDKLDMTSKVFASFGTMRAAMTRIMRGRRKR